MSPSSAWATSIFLVAYLGSHVQILLAANSHFFYLTYKLPTPMFCKHQFSSQFSYKRHFYFCDICTFTFVFVFTIVSVKIWSFVVTLKSLCELSYPSCRYVHCAYISLIIMQLAKPFWSVLVGHSWIDCVTFSHWVCNAWAFGFMCSLIWSTWALVSWRYIGVMIKPLIYFIWYDTYVRVFKTIGMLIIWRSIGTLVKLLIWVVTIHWRIGPKHWYWFRLME